MRTLSRAARGGFTIIELLTVIAVIILLLAMIVPGINYAKRIANETRVKAEVKSLGEGVEHFYGIYGYYPPSDRTTRTGTKFTCGAEKLAEAMVGLDLRGFDPQSTFDVESTIFANVAYVGAKSLDRRKEMTVTPSVDMVAVDVNSTNPNTLYNGAAWGNLYATAAGYRCGRLLCDSIRVKEVMGNNGYTMKAGTPYLYYRANTDSRKFNKKSATGNIYNYLDNQDLLALTPLSGEKPAHAWYTGDSGTAREAGMKLFYDAITNPAFTTGDLPYNMDNYLIISAGYDGIFGTKDDITNFKR
jgi:type II secretory pathway pseudopilin PulG